MEKRTHILKMLVGDESYEFDVARELHIDRDDIDTELANQASLYAWFAVICERARFLRLRLEAELDEIEYDMVEKSRQKHEGKKKADRPTDTALKAAARASKEYRAVLRTAQETERSERLLGVLRDAFYMRKDTLVQLARSRSGEGSSPSAAEVERIKRNLGLR